MAYILPQVLVYQEFTQVPETITEPLRAFITGPHYKLFRYSVAAEKALIDLGAYDPDVDEEYSWPNKPTGAVVDTSYIKLYMDDAILRYYDSGTASDTWTSVTTYKNRIRSSGFIAKTANGYNRSSELYNRDVQVGDVVHISDGTTTVETTVIDLAADVADGDAAEISADDDNQATLSNTTFSFPGSVLELHGDALANDVEPTAISVTNYNGLTDGVMTETYTIECTQASIGGDLSTALFKVISASGLDDDQDVAPGTYSSNASTITIGARGFTATFSNSGAPTDNFLVGQSWKFVNIKKAYTVNTYATTGTYTGDEDRTYVITVTKGNDGLTETDGSGTATITVATTDGEDYSGPHTVEDNATYFDIGTLGLQIKFTNATVGRAPVLVKGDKFYVDAFAETETQISTLVLAHNLPEDWIDTDELADGSSSSSIYLPELNVELFIKKNIEISEELSSTEQWDATTTAFTVNQNIRAYDSSWRSGLYPLYVRGGDLFVEYRALLTTYAGSIYTMEEIGDVEDTLGSVSVDNPLALGVYKALLNSNGTVVKYMAVASDDLAGYSDVVDALYDAEGIYSIVPLSKVKDIQDLFAAHVDAVSTPEEGRWRIIWANSDATETDNIIGENANHLATVTAFEDETSEYRLVSATSDPEFQTNGVAAGDLFRINYAGADYEEYVVEDVINEDTILLESGPSIAINVAARFEIWRNLSKDAIAEDYADKSGAFASKRVFHVWPDVISNGGEEMSGIFLCAALAGLVSGVVPHQGLTNLAILGFDDVSRTTDFFTRSQLNTMAESGTFIVTENADGTVYSRHQVSTDMTDVNTRELSVTKNVDSISYTFLRTMEKYIGVANVTPSALDLVRTDLLGTIEFLKSASFLDRIGGQLIDGKIQKLKQHTTLKDRVTAEIALTIPYPMNNIEIFLIV